MEKYLTGEKMKNKLLTILLLLIYLIVEILLMFSLACLLVNGRIFFAIIAMCSLHYHAVIVSECFKKLI